MRQNTLEVMVRNTETTQLNRKSNEISYLSHDSSLTSGSMQDACLIAFLMDVGYWLYLEIVHEECPIFHEAICETACAACIVTILAR